MGGKWTRSDGPEDTTISKFTVGKDYQEFPDQKVGEGIRRTASWKSSISRHQLQQKRLEFWQTRLDHRRVWAVIKQAIEADASTAVILLEAAEIRMVKNSLTNLVDSYDHKFEVPIFMLNDPIEFAEGKVAPSKKKPSKVLEISIKIRCFQMQSKDYDVKIFNDKTALDLKKVFQELLEEEKPLECMRVFFGGKELKDDETLIANNIRRHCVVQIMLKKVS